MCVSMLACLLGPTTYRKFQMSAFNILIFHDVHTDVRVLQSRENECEGLLPDCRVGVKESESEDDSS